MLNTELVHELQADTLAPGFVRPAWEDYCFANIPDTILSLFGNETAQPLPEEVFNGIVTDVKHIALIFVDGFGWNHFQRIRHQHPFLIQLVEHGTVTPLTSIYPTETAAAVSTIHTGCQPSTHGVLGWNAHIEALGGHVQTLPFVNREWEPLEKVHNNPDPAKLINEQPLYERLDTRSVLIQPKEFEDNLYDQQVKQGAKFVGHRNIPQAAYRVREQLENADEPTYCHCYLPTVDALSHEKGADHPETDAQLGAICTAIQRELVERLDPAVAEETLLLLVADHGEVDSTPKTRIGIDELEIEPHLKRDATGKPIPALGGPRNLQFHARDGHRAALRTELEQGLAPLSPLMLTRETIIEEGLFGTRQPSERFLQRYPDLLVVPRDGFAWYDDGHLSNIGMHGGMHPDEMLIPFAAARMDTLQNVRG
jgi:Type I phosphodiesterase / nucleotide pyrophosphatase